MDSCLPYLSSSKLFGTVLHLAIYLDTPISRSLIFPELQILCQYSALVHRAAPALAFTDYQKLSQSPLSIFRTSFAWFLLSTLSSQASSIYPYTSSLQQQHLTTWRPQTSSLSPTSSPYVSSRATSPTTAPTTGKPKSPASSPRRRRHPHTNTPAGGSRSASCASPSPASSSRSCARASTVETTAARRSSPSSRVSTQRCRSRRGWRGALA